MAHGTLTMDIILDKLRYYDIFKQNSNDDLVSMLNYYCMDNKPVQFASSLEYKTIKTEIEINFICLDEQKHLCGQYNYRHTSPSKGVGFHHAYDTSYDEHTERLVHNPKNGDNNTRSKPAQKKKGFCASMACCQQCGCGDKCLIF